MTAYVALLRGVNVGGNKKVPMSDLRELLTRLGFTGVKTLLQSGNAVFNAKKSSAAALEAKLERETAQCIGTECDYVVRTFDEIEDVVQRNPFRAESENDPGHLLVVFLKSEADAKAIEWAGPETIRGNGKHIYIHYPDGVGQSKLTHALIEKKLGVRGTARNWNTVVKLREAAHVLRDAR